MARLAASQQSALEALARDLERVFGGRLQSLVAYRGHGGNDTLHSLAIVEGLTFRDLSACLPLADSWHRSGLAVPLMLSRSELGRTVDIFPLEYSAMIATHVVVRGRNPFAEIQVRPDDLRRACEAQAKSHLIHLREAFLESHGDGAAIARLIAASAAPFRAVLTNIARLPDERGTSGELAVTPSDESLAQFAETRMGAPADVIAAVLASSRSGYSAIADPSALLSRYIDAVQRVWDYVDKWR